MSKAQDALARRSDDDGPMDLATRYYRALHSPDEAALRGVLDPRFVLHAGGGRIGIDAYLAMLAEYRTGFSGLRVEMGHSLRDDLWMAVRTTTSGTHTGLFLGHATTHRAFSSAGADFLRLGDGRILEIESHFDTIGMLAQLGLYKAGRR